MLAGAVGWARSAAELSPRAVADEAARTFTIAVIGSAVDRDRLVERILGPDLRGPEREHALSVFRPMDQAPVADLAKALSFRIWAPSGDGAIGGRDHRSLPFQGDLVAVTKAMLELRPDLAVALGRRLPGFRAEACRMVLRDACRNNAQISLLSALPGVLPITAPFLPVSSLADAVLLTKNQVMMVMRLAALHGERPGFTRQIRELLATVATALGWRTVARQVVAMVPAGVGAGLKAAIAWSGTYAVGKAALMFYERGRMPTVADIRAFEQEGRADGQTEVEQLVSPPSDIGAGVSEVAGDAEVSDRSENQEPG
jgi:uncharacterized protein (DUF697 family)